MRYILYQITSLGLLHTGHGSLMRVASWLLTLLGCHLVGLVQMRPILLVRSVFNCAKRFVRQIIITHNDYFSNMISFLI